jgi:hypothetical protein
MLLGFWVTLILLLPGPKIFSCVQPWLFFILSIFNYVYIWRHLFIIRTFWIRCTVTGFEFHRYICVCVWHLTWINKVLVETSHKIGVEHLKESCCPESEAADLKGVDCSWKPVLNHWIVDVLIFGSVVIFCHMPRPSNVDLLMTQRASRPLHFESNAQLWIISYETHIGCICNKTISNSIFLQKILVG